MKNAPSVIVLLAAGILEAAACSTSSGQSGPAVASCSAPGEATPGPADVHCASAAPDGGALVETVTLACNATIASGDDGGGDDGGPPQCEYGLTNYGMEADDDDCKYHVAWSSTPICETPGAVTFTIVATVKATGMPLKGAAPVTEVIGTSPADCGAGTAPNCDDCSTLLGKNSGQTMTEGPPGTYTAPIEFQQAGPWTVRFHFFENCTDAPNAPHGHAAFHITVP